MSVRIKESVCWFLMKRLSYDCTRQALWGTTDPSTAVIHVWLTSIHIHLCLFHLRLVGYSLQWLAWGSDKHHFVFRTRTISDIKHQGRRSDGPFCFCWELVTVKRPQNVSGQYIFCRYKPFITQSFRDVGEYTIFSLCLKTMWWFSSIHC